MFSPVLLHSSSSTFVAACATEAETDANAVQPKSDISSILFNAEFVASVKKLLELLNPVAELTNFCQKNTSSAADAAEQWLKLYENGSDEMRTIIGNRMKKSHILNTVTMTANFFHPVYRGKRLNETQQQEVKSYVFNKLDASGLESFRKFTADEDLFAKLNEKKIISPKTFWHYAAELGHEKLASFAMKFLQIPASTAQLERIFSNWAYIHDDIRNRLSNETSKKLVNVYFTLRTADKISDEGSDDETEVGN